MTGPDTGFDTEVVRGGNKEAPPDRSEHNQRSRLMCFTWFHEDPIVFNPNSMTYLAYGHETCPSTGRGHLQGWVLWKNARWHFSVRKQFKAFFVCCKGSIDQQDAYCSKESTLTTFGERPKQGLRLDLKAQIEGILEGAVTADEIAVTMPEQYHQYGRTFHRVEDIYLRKKFRTEMTTCEWIWGPTGVGKSHKAFEGYDPSSHYLWRHDNGWWEGYVGQDTVIINDFRGEIKYSELLQLIDKWPFFVKRRNREPVPFISRHVIITSSGRPEDVYHGVLDRDNIDQLLRRVKVTHMTSAR